MRGDRPQDRDLTGRARAKLPGAKGRRVWMGPPRSVPGSPPSGTGDPRYRRCSPLAACRLPGRWEGGRACAGPPSIPTGSDAAPFRWPDSAFSSHDSMGFATVEYLRTL